MLRPTVFMVLLSCLVVVCTGSIDLTGAWLLSAAYLEEYSIRNASDTDSFVVACDQGPCTSWKTAVINITDQVAGACVVHFDSGTVHSGNIDLPFADAIVWQDGSVWNKPLPPGTVLDVHILPHSHNDPGWKSSCDELYNASVRTIYTSFLTQLQANPDRTYVAEIAVFWSMFMEDPLVNDTLKDMARRAVASGQMEFFGGGFTQNDEAAVRFEDTIDNMALGHLWAQSVLGSRPITGAWQADPFGHSATQAYIYTRLALDGYVFGRPMQDDPITVSQSAALWHPTSSFPGTSGFDAYTLLTHDHFLGYWEPYRDLHGSLVAGNATAVAAGLLSAITAVSSRRPLLSTVMLMFGDDFAWFDADVVYPTLDAAIAALDGSVTPGGLRLRVRYSTPSTWLGALAEEVGATSAGGSRGTGGTTSSYTSSSATFTGFPARPAWDMMPLIGCEFPRPWTGFYTSRPEFKGKFRAGSAALRAANALHSLARDPLQWEDQAARLSVLWRAMGLVQHHDAITGDSYDFVMEDFGQRVEYGMGNASLVMGQAIARLQGYDTSGSTIPSACYNASALPCAPVMISLTGGKVATLTVFNPLGWVRDEDIELIVPPAAGGGSPSLIVTDLSTGNPVPSQVTPTVMGWVPAEFGTGPWYSLLFHAFALPPLGYATFSVGAASADLSVGASTLCARPIVNSVWTLTAPGSALALTFNASGVLQGAVYADSSAPSEPSTVLTAVAVVQQYTTAPGWENAWDFSTNGLGPELAQAFPGTPTATVSATTACPLFNEIVTEIDPASGTRTRFRIYANSDIAHIFTTTGPFTMKPLNMSHDVILRVQTNVSSAGTFYTDSNGLELLKRVRDARPWWNGSYVDSSDPVTSNYYPTTAGIFISDSTGVSVGLMTGSATGLGSSQGCTSMNDGVLECVINRMVLDGTNASVTGNRAATVHNVLLFRPTWAQATGDFRSWEARLANPPVVMASAGGPAIAPSAAVWAGLTTPLPPTAHILTLQTLPPGLNVSSSFTRALAIAAADAAGITAPASDPDPLSLATLVLRLHHILAAGEGSPAAGPVSLDLNMFKPWNTQSATEMTLSLTRSMDDAQAERVQWPQEGEGLARLLSTAPVERTRPMHEDAGSLAVTLLPLDIATYILESQ